MRERSTRGVFILRLAGWWLLLCAAMATGDPGFDNLGRPVGITGACCVDGACQPNLTQQQCEALCGQWQGPGSTCAGTQCSEPLGGVCCLLGVCDDMPGFDSCTCAGGVWVEDEPDCTAVVCDPVGRCCLGGTCNDTLTQTQCEDACGVWGGAGSDCTGPLEPCPLFFGACCVADQCLAGIGPTSCDCQGGIWHNGDTCTLNDQTDCDGNGIIDLCEDLADCNNNGIPDPCDLIDGTSQDCNNNGIPDECELDQNCALNFALDCNFDGELNECDPDCQPNGVSDVCDLLNPFLIDCGGGGPDVGNAFFGELLHNGTCAECHGFGGFGDTAPNHRNFSRYTYQWKTSGCVFHTGGAFSLSPEDYANLQAYLSDLGEGGNGVPDECEGLADCDSDGIADACVIAAAEDQGLNADCNGNLIPDDCDIAAGTSEDCNSNDIPDECDIDPTDPDGDQVISADCNGNGVPDECDIAAGTSEDCNGDGMPNECDPDCNGNLMSDICDILGGAEDCDGNNVPDECDPDCQPNGTADACDITSGTSMDLNGNGIPDECEADCNGNGLPDSLDLLPGDLGKSATVDYGAGGPAIPDCEPGNDVFLEDTLTLDFGGQCDVVQHLTVSLDIAHTWIGDLFVALRSPAGTVITLLSRIGLDEDNPLCTGGACCGNSAQDLVVALSDDFTASIEDFNASTEQYRPDAGASGNPSALSTFAGESECGDWTLRVHDGSNSDSGALRGWTLDLRAFPLSADCNGNGVPDECDINDGTSGDCNGNGIPDDCEDCNGNGVADECDISSGTSNDCNGNAVPDECDGLRDCNGNGLLDECDIAAGSSEDCNLNGVPDECDLSGAGGLYVSGFVSRNVVEYGAMTGAYLGQFVPAGQEGLFAPTAVLYQPSGDLLVADITLNRIRRHDGSTGEYLGDFVDGDVPAPVDMVIGPNGNLFVLSLQGGQVFEFDGLSGAFLDLFAALPPGPVPENAFTLTFAPSGNLLITNNTTAQVLAFDGTTGTLIGSFTSGGMLSGPLDATFGPNGNLFVSDPLANNIQEFDGSSGAFVGVFVNDIFGGAFFFGALSFGPNGNLYLGHSLFNVVLAFDGTDGSLVQVLPATPSLSLPIQIAFRPPSNDCNDDGIPDECQDCNNNQLADECDITSGTSEDVNGNGIPDECEGPDIDLQLVVRMTDSGLDQASTLPASDGDAQRGEPFVVELWATDRGALNSGLEQVYVNLGFDPAMVQAQSIDHRPPFTDSPGGTVDNVAGTITDLGGLDLSGSAPGQEPQWSRIAVVHFDAVGCPNVTAFALSAGAGGVVAVDRGIIDPANIAFGDAALGIGVDCVYDLDGDATGLINAGDLGIFAQSWLKAEGDPDFNPASDFDCSGVVDAGDLGWFAAVWLQQCVDLGDTELPECRRCGQ